MMKKYGQSSKYKVCVCLTYFVLATHGELDEEFLRILADKHVRRAGFAVGKLLPVVLLRPHISDVNRPKETRSRIGAGKRQVLGWKEQRGRERIYWTSKIF